MEFAMHNLFSLQGVSMFDSVYSLLHVRMKFSANIVVLN